MSVRNPGNQTARATAARISLWFKEHLENQKVFLDYDAIAKYLIPLVEARDKTMWMRSCQYMKNHLIKEVQNVVLFENDDPNENRKRVRRHLLRVKVPKYRRDAQLIHELPYIMKTIITNGIHPDDLNINDNEDISNTGH